MIGATHKPYVFIGSSSEKKIIADTLKVLLKDVADCHVWDEAFPLSQLTLESIMQQFKKADFGIFVLSDEDMITMRKKKFKISRDNVIFESGMSIGALGKDRTFLVVPVGDDDYHLMTDILGFTCAPYKNDAVAVDPSNAVKEAADQIQLAIRQSLWNNLNLEINTRIILNELPTTTHKLKIWMTLVNKEQFPITCDAYQFTLKDFDVDQTGRSAKTYRPQFFVYQHKDSGDHIRKSSITLEPKEDTNCYVPISLESGKRWLRSSPLMNPCGKFEIAAFLHRDGTDIYRYTLDIVTDHVENSGNIEFKKEDLIGTWTNKWDGGSERVFIDKEYKYFINENDRPSFVVQYITVKDNKAFFCKKSIGTLPTFDDALTIIDRDTLIGEEWSDSGKRHPIRYTRRK